MKFSLEKNTPPEENKPSELELTQEQFDAQIIKEADKLGVSLQQLQSEINKYGGPEKFKEIFEKKADDRGNMAGMEIRLDEMDIKGKKNAVEMASIAGGILAGLDALMISGIDQQGDLSLENIKHPIDTITQAWENGLLDQVMVGIVALVAAVSVGSFISAIKSGIETRKEKRKKKIDELKFKMTDTEVKRK